MGIERSVPERFTRPRGMDRLLGRIIEKGLRGLEVPEPSFLERAAANMLLKRVASGKFPFLLVMIDLGEGKNL